jgi:cobalamin biosynthesis Mg chelatase CobN
MRRHWYIAAIWALLLVLLTLAACITQPENPAAPGVVMVLGTPVVMNAQANADHQAAATAEIVRVYAQATLDSANATLNAAQIQQQNSSDAVAAQAAAAAEIVRANAQATVDSASSTQSAAQTLTQFSLEMTVEQQNRNEIAAGTQTAVANLIATQTQSALATSQWYADQSRQRQEQSRSSIAFLWMWCLPVFLTLFAGLCLWGFWRWLRIQQNRQRIAGQPVEKPQTPADPGQRHERFLPPGSDIIDSQFRPTKPGGQMHGWLDEIKHKLVKHEKDNDDNPDS